MLFIAEVSRRVDNTSPCSLRLAAKKNDGLTYSLGWVVSFVSGDPCTWDAGDAAVHRKVRPQVGPASSSVCLFVGVCMSAARVRAALVSLALWWRGSKGAARLEKPWEKTLVYPLRRFGEHTPSHAIRVKTKVQKHVLVIVCQMSENVNESIAFEF